MKRMTIVLIAIAVLFGGGAVWYIYADTTAKNTIDLLGNAKMTFEGTSGNGMIASFDKNIVYDKSNGNIQQFVKSIEYKYSATDNLKNGEKIKVEARFDPTWASNLGLNVTNAERTFTVKGLNEKYRTASAVPDSIIKAMKEKTFEKLKEHMYYRADKTYTYCGTYFLKREHNDAIISVYKNVETDSLGIKSATYFKMTINCVGDGTTEKDVNNSSVVTLTHNDLSQGDDSKLMNVIKEETEAEEVTKID